MNVIGIPLTIDSILICIKKVINNNDKRNVLMGEETRHVTLI